MTMGYIFVDKIIHVYLYITISNNFVRIKG